MYSFCTPDIFLDVFNTVQISRNRERGKFVPAVAIITALPLTGIGIIFGIGNDDYRYNDIPISLVGIGTGTILLSAWNLMLKPKDNRTSFNIYSFPAKGNMGLACSLIHRF